MNTYLLNTVKVIGCALGLKTYTGVPMLKPWTIATNDSYLFQALQGRLCPDYAPEMVQIIHRAWQRSVRSELKRQREDEVVIP
eukprot:5505114-Heterocapsa_arctica.AAC.1